MSKLLNSWGPGASRLFCFLLLERCCARPCLLISIDTHIFINYEEKKRKRHTKYVYHTILYWLVLVNFHGCFLISRFTREK